jgi:hypothetical protein
MKITNKLLVLYITLALFTSCDTIDSIIDYWASLSGTTEGTTETQFIFDVDTNDDSYTLYCDDVELLDSRSTGYTFESGEHEISVITTNDATDTMTITVSVPEIIVIPEITTRFIIHKTSTDDFAENVASLNYPILTFDGNEYDVSTMNTDVAGFLVIARMVGYERQIHLYMNILDGQDTFLFHSGNMLSRLGFTVDELSPSNMDILLDYFNREEVAREAVGIRFELSITKSNYFSEYDMLETSYIFDGVETVYTEAVGDVSEDGIKTIVLGVVIRSEVDFMLRSGNFLKFFRFELEQMTLEEVRIALDVLDRYSPATLLDLVYLHDSENPVLVDYGYVVP